MPVTGSYTTVGGAGRAIGFLRKLGGGGNIRRRRRRRRRRRSVIVVAGNTQVCLVIFLLLSAYSTAVLTVGRAFTVRYTHTHPPSFPLFFFSLAYIRCVLYTYIYILFFAPLHTRHIST